MFVAVMVVAVIIWFVDVIVEPHDQRHNLVKFIQRRREFSGFLKVGR